MTLRLCRRDGRCQYAIDHGADGLGHCPEGSCAMPCHDCPECGAICDCGKEDACQHYRSGACESQAGYIHESAVYAPQKHEEKIVVPRLAWDGFVAMMEKQLGKKVNRDKTPAELIEIARAMLAAKDGAHKATVPEKETTG